MQVEVTEDAPVLVPNKEHQNFTRTDEVIPKGTTLKGENKMVDGMRRGEPFRYKLFVTSDKKIIYINKTKPIMNTTQVYLSADAQQTPTIVDVPPRKLFTPTTITGAVIGGFLGVYISKKKNLGKTNAYAIGGAVAGLLIARYYEKKTIKVVKSK